MNHKLSAAIDLVASYDSSATVESLTALSMIILLTTAPTVEMISMLTTLNLSITYNAPYRLLSVGVNLS